MPQRHRSRPDTSASAVKQTLIDLGHAETWAGPVASDFKLIVPLLLRQLGADGITESIRDAWRSYELSDAALHEAAKSAVEWAEHVLETYRRQPS